MTPRRSALRAAPLALLGALVSGCFSVMDEHRTLILPEPEPIATAPPGPSAPANPAPSVVFEDLSGAEAARAHAAFAPLRDRLAECRPGTGGVVRLRVVKRGPRAEYAFDATTTLDPRRRTCVLEALSTVDLDGPALEGSAFTASPSARPPGFTGHVRIEW